MSRQVVARASEVAPGSCKIVIARGREIGLFNIGGESLRCPTAVLTRAPSCAAAMIVGLAQSSLPGEYRLSRPGEFIRCPWHGWEFDIRTGQSWCDPKSVRARQFQVRVESGSQLLKGPYLAETFQVFARRELPRHRSVGQDGRVLHFPSFRSWACMAM